MLLFDNRKHIYMHSESRLSLYKCDFCQIAQRCLVLSKLFFIDYYKLNALLSFVIYMKITLVTELQGKLNKTVIYRSIFLIVAEKLKRSVRKRYAILDLNLSCNITRK